MKKQGSGGAAEATEMRHLGAFIKTVGVEAEGTCGRVRHCEEQAAFNRL